MIPFIRSTYFLDGRDTVEILVEVHRDEAAFLDPTRRPAMQDYLHTTETALSAAMVVPADNWGNRELLIVGQQLLDEHPTFGGQGWTLRPAPTPPAPAPAPDPAVVSPSAS